MVTTAARRLPDPVRPAGQDDVSELERLLLLAEIANDVDGFESLSSATTHLCRAVLGVMNCQFACVRLPDTSGKQLVVVGASDRELFPTEDVLELQPTDVSGVWGGSRTPSVEAFATGQAQMISALDNVEGHDAWQERTRRLGIRALLALPLIRHGEVRGVLNCHWTHEFTPSDPQMLTLRVVGRLAALAVESASRSDVRRRNEKSLTTARDQSVVLAQEEERLIAAQTELVAAGARQPNAALRGIASILSDHLRTAVGIVGESDGLIVIQGPPDQTRSLASSLEAEKTGDGAVDTVIRRAVDGPTGALGAMVFSSDSRDDPYVRRLLSFTGNLLTTVLQRRAGDSDAATMARPYALLALCHGDLEGSQIETACDVLGIGLNTPLDVAVARFDTAEAATRFASYRRASGWGRVVAQLAIGREVVVLLESEPATVAVPPLDGTDIGLNTVGVSRRGAKITALPTISARRGSRLPPPEPAPSPSTAIWVRRPTSSCTYRPMIFAPSSTTTSGR